MTEMSFILKQTRLFLQRGVLLLEFNHLTVNSELKNTL